MLVLGVALVVQMAPVAFSPTTGTRTYSPMEFGAVGDGSSDDTRALQRAFDALKSGDTLMIPTGTSFLHSDVLMLRVPGIRVSGGGSLLASDEARSAIFVDAPDVVLEEVVLGVRGTTRRWFAFEQMKLRLGGHPGITVRGVTIDGAAAAGVYVGTGASRFLIEDVHVRGTRADGIHVTGGAHDGVVRRPVVSGAGDDGVAVVSYQGDGTPVRRVQIDDARVSANSWGRGLSVVGGEDVTITGGRVEGSSGAGLYIASEGPPYYTFAPRRVRVTGLVIDGANRNPALGHGAVLVYAGSAGHPPIDVEMSDLRIRRTHAGAPWQVGVVAETGAQVLDAAFTDVIITGTGTPFAVTNIAPGCCERLRWTVNGFLLPDQ